MAMWMVIAVVMMVIFGVGIDGSVKGFGGGGAITVNITIIKNVEGDSSGDDGDIWSWQ